MRWCTTSVNSETCKISIIIPTLNEQDSIKNCLTRLQLLRQLGHEIIVVDGGSSDATVLLSNSLCDKIITSEKSRSIQMNAGARAALGHCFLFLHADTVLPENVHGLISKIDDIKNKWGRFNIRLSGQHCSFRVIETCMNIRSRLTGVVTGDQALFTGKALFYKVGGYPEIALMEDIAISSRLLNYSKPVCIEAAVISSSRRWEKNGIIKTIIKMWLLRLLYFLRYDTNRLVRFYE